MAMPKPVTNEEALSQVEKATESEPVKGEDLLESPELKELLRAAKKRCKQSSSEPLSE